MAIAPSTLYPTQTVNTDPGYPRGKARNVTVSGDNTGTPLEKEWLNDLWGFEQALLAEAALTPSGTADKVGASQYLTALKTILIPISGGTRTLSAPLTITGQPVTFGAGLVVAGGITITGGSVIDSAFFAGGVFTGPLNLNATTTVGAPLVMAGTGRLRRRATVVPDIGNRTLTIADGDLLIARAVAAPCDWTLGNTGAAFPDEIEVYNATSGNAITVKDSAGSPLAVLKNGSGSSRSGRFVFDLDGTSKFVALGAEDAT